MKGYRISTNTINQLKLTSDYSLDSNLQEGLDKVFIENTKKDDNNHIIIDGSAIANQWFPNIKNGTFFISHSHADQPTVEKFAGYLKKATQKEVFLDYKLWGYSDDLLKIIDNKFAQNGHGTYDYEIRNETTSNVHLMLSTALNKMINQCPIFLFVTSESSLDSTQRQTLSPWIMEELNTFYILQESNSEYRSLGENVQKSFDFSYDVHKIINEMVEIKSVDDFDAAISKYRS